ncbi:type II secretion system protein N [Rhodanobacter sp. DHB23]|uniref:type II secretion system protein N n=1 Tax=Rhodanobacter sp. DHB23 TaxID=2775923 RepID=UPI001CE12C17|nr:type II secretion system protein N [Rhodanobacter sp. DHB23]
MKLLGKILAAVAVPLLAIAALLWWLPARWAMPLLQPSLHGVLLQQAGGTLWDGHADDVRSPDGRVPGRVQWQLSHRALFGQVELQLDFAGPRFGLRGHMRKLPAGQVEWSGLQAHADLAALADPRLRLPLGQPRGELVLNAQHAVLQGGWPLELQADWQWRQAAMHMKNGDVPLGDLHGTLAAQGGVIHAQWQDDGQGPLRTTGEFALSPLGWRLEAMLQARHADPALQRWLAALGRPGADGSIHITRSGGMAAAITGKTAR